MSGGEAGEEEIADGDFFADTDKELRAGVGSLPPFLLFGEDGWRASDVDEADVGLAADGDVGGSPVEVQRLAWCGAGALGEDEDASACLKFSTAGVEHLVGVAIGNVVGGANDAADEKVVPKRLFDDAIAVRHEGGEENVVDEAWVVGDDEAMAVIDEAIGVFDAIVEGVQSAHEAGEDFEAGADATLGDPGAGFTRAEEAAERDDAKGKGESKYPETGKGNAGTDVAPELGDAAQEAHDKRGWVQRQAL